MLYSLSMNLMSCSCSFAAAFKPYILIPGANHGQTTQDPINVARGDMPATAADADALLQYGRTIGAFLVAHEGGSEDIRQSAATELLQMCRATAEMIGPYFMANGEGKASHDGVLGEGGGEGKESLEGVTGD
jgi:hypothetical protein